MGSIYHKLLKKIENTIIYHNLLTEKDSVLTALSGGGDSVFLIHMLSALKDKYGFLLSAAHLNHKLRAEADSEEQFAADLCRELNIKCFTKKTDIAAISKAYGESCETAGRKERYTFFRDLQKQYGFTKIATAHHLDDNAETILMHFIRGSGANGLKGIEYSRPDGIIRPLLNISKHDIIECCHEQGWEYATDSSNFEAVYTRNRVRLELIPEILKYNSNFPEVVTKNAILFAEDEDFINTYTKGIFKENYINGGLLKKAADIQPQAVKRRLIQMLYQKYSSSVQNLSMEYINSVLSLKHTGQSVSLPGGIRAVLSYDKYFIEPQNETCVNFEYTLIPGETLYIPQSGQYWLIKEAKSPGKNVFFSPDNTVFTVRNRRAGDFFYPVGMTGKKKLSDFFTDKKIPRTQRDLIPVMTAGKDIINVGGSHRDRRFYNSDNKNNLYSLEIYDKKC